MRVIAAPTNLGLRPLRAGHLPGTWRAPAALIAAGLLEAVNCRTIMELPTPICSPEAQPGTRLRNGPSLRTFNLALADLVAAAGGEGDFALVIGGDCSILLGALAGARRRGALSLVHIDGHSDFRHPGNYESEKSLGAVAGMDLALATGRGEALLTEWPGISAPLVAERYVVQLGERESRDADFAWPDVNDTDIQRIDVFEARKIGPHRVLERIGATINQVPEQDFWVHLDLDVLDQTILWAVDSPGSPGIAPEDLVTILKPLVADRRCRGMTVTIFDPDLDPDGKCAATIVEFLGCLPFPTPACGWNAPLTKTKPAIAP